MTKLYYYKKGYFFLPVEQTISLSFFLINIDFCKLFMQVEKLSWDNSIHNGLSGMDHC